MYIKHFNFTTRLAFFLALSVFSDSLACSALAQSAMTTSQDGSAVQSSGAEVLIPLPLESNSVNAQPEVTASTLSQPVSTNSSDSNETLLPLPHGNGYENKIIIPAKPAEIDEIVIPAGTEEIPAVASAVTIETHEAVATPTVNVPVFPKDTSSALFMIMKTWECVDYDGHTLIEHAVNVYSQEAEDPFTIRGLADVKPFKLTLKEADVTLDELLDVIAEQANIDWGVDLVQKVIYIYPTKLQ